MKQRTDRRKSGPGTEDPYAENGRAQLVRERRKRRDRRVENLEVEERQLLLSEMPWLLPDKAP